MTVNLKKVNPPTLPDAASLGYSQITVCAPGKMVFISGQVAWTREGGPVPGDLAAQARVAMQNLVHALEAVGGAVGNLAAMRVYVVDLQPEHSAALFPVLKAHLGDVQPTLTVVGVTGLAAADLKIEIEATAIV